MRVFWSDFLRIGTFIGVHLLIIFWVIVFVYTFRTIQAIANVAESIDQIVSSFSELDINSFISTVDVAVSSVVSNKDYVQEIVRVIGDWVRVKLPKNQKQVYISEI